MSPESHGTFIAAEVDDSVRADVELAKKLEEACPVDIFAAADDGVHVAQENLDECVLCGLCLDASPPGTVKVIEGNRFGLGELDGSKSERVLALSQRLAKAGFRAPVTSDIRAEIWLKVHGASLHRFGATWE